MAIYDYIRLIRVKQWYKNLVVFLPLLLGKTIFIEGAIFAHILGFIALCLISSSNYVYNDLIDIEKDKKNPEKMNRPLASGKITGGWAIIFIFLLLGIGIGIGLMLSIPFLMFGFALWTSSTLYTLFLKNQPFMDVLSIAINFVIRTMAGPFVIATGFVPYVVLSPWMILCPFFFALFLAVAKRKSEVSLLGKKAGKHRWVLNFYDEKITSALMIVSMTLFVMSYSLWTFFSSFPNLIYTIPFVLYIVFKIFWFAENGREEARHPHLLIKNIGIVVTCLIISLLFFLVVIVFG